MSVMHLSRKGMFVFDSVVKFIIVIIVLVIVLFLIYAFREKMVEALDFVKGVLP